MNATKNSASHEQLHASSCLHRAGTLRSAGRPKPPRNSGPTCDYLARLIEGEAQRRQRPCHCTARGRRPLPLLKTLDQFDWNWPKKINRTQVQNLFRLAFLKDKPT